MAKKTSSTEYRRRNLEHYRAYEREYYNKNRERKLEQGKRSRDANRERRNARDRERYAQNRERERARCRKKAKLLKFNSVRYKKRQEWFRKYQQEVYYPKNRDRILAKAAVYRENNREKIRADCRRRNSKKKFGDFWETHQALVVLNKELAKFPKQAKRIDQGMEARARIR